MTEPGRTDAGFTFFELLVVLAIVSAATAIALPSISSGFSSLSARSAALRVSSALLEAREKALRDRSVYYAEVTGRTLVIRTGEGRIVKEHSFSPGLTLASTPSISFSPGGFSNGGEIKVSSGDSGYSVKVMAAGRPRIEAFQ